jgi:hypothetical protein
MGKEHLNSGTGVLAREFLMWLAEWFLNASNSDSSIFYYPDLHI